MPLDANFTSVLVVAGVLFVLFSVQAAMRSAHAARIERLERKVDTLYEKLGESYQPPGVENVSPEVVDLIRRGRKIDAIKLHRERTGLGLKDAKDVVDAIQERDRAGKLY